MLITWSPNQNNTIISNIRKRLTPFGWRSPQNYRKALQVSKCIQKNTKNNCKFKRYTQKNLTTCPDIFIWPQHSRTYANYEPMKQNSKGKEDWRSKNVRTNSWEGSCKFKIEGNISWRKKGKEYGSRATGKQ